MYGKTPTPAPKGLMKAVMAIAALMLVAFAAPASAATNIEATQKAVNFLSADVAVWTAGNGCAACHRQGAALFGMSNAKSNGYDMSVFASNGKSNFDNLQYIAQQLRNFQRVNGGWDSDSNTSYSSFGLAGFDQYVSTQHSSSLVMAANYAVAMQRADGKWIEEDGRYPTAYGNVGVTARIMVALAQAKQRVDPAKAAQYQAALDKAAAYLRAHINDGNTAYNGDGMPYTFQVSWAIVGLKAAGAGANNENTIALQSLADRLMARSASAGSGWGQSEGAVATDFDTGIAVYALCLAGREPDVGGKLAGAIDWLKARQSNGGYWGSGGFIDIPTSFAALGLSCYGDYGVEVSVVGTDRKVVEFDWATSQTVTYTFKIRNRGYKADTYSLSTAGGLPGWTTTLDRNSLFLASGTETTFTATVTVPARLLPALASEVTVTATSGGNPGVKGSSRVTTYTNPPPPVTGLATTTTILNPAANASVTIGTTTPLRAKVVDANNNQVKGPGKGVVTFFVAGVAIGADNDADGDGVFTVDFATNTSNWTVTGAQDYRAVYSGVSLPAPQTNLLGSVAAQTLTIKAFPYKPPNATLCNRPAYTRFIEMNVCGYVTPRENGATVDYIAFIINGGEPIVVSPTAANSSAGYVEALVTLRDGPNVIQIIARDSFGGISMKQGNVYVDRIPPVVTIMSPKDGDYFPSTIITVTSMIDDQTPTRVTTRIYKVSHLESGSGTVEHTIDTVNSGWQTISVEATDAAGNVTKKQVRVLIAPNAPLITTIPGDGAMVVDKPDNLVPYTIRVDSLAASTIKLTGVQTVNGDTWPLPRGGGVINALLVLPNGTHHLDIKATTEGNAVTSVHRVIHHDNQGPEISHPWPWMDAEVSGLTALLAEVTDTPAGVATVEFMLDWTDALPVEAQADNTWASPLDTTTLAEGPHVLTVTATDRVGHTSESSILFWVLNDDGGGGGGNNLNRTMAPQGGESGTTFNLLAAPASSESGACPVKSVSSQQ
ncbi:ABC transporter substrate-binding protein [Myxococcaceae bacterium GXIMD 01537]